MENEIKNEIMVSEGTTALSVDKRNESVRKCTLDLTKEDNQVMLYNILTGDADVLINDIIGQEIVMTGAYIDKHPSAVVDENTGEVTGSTTKYRIVIFDNEGKTYATGSYGIYNSLEMIMSIFGEPSEDHPIKVKVDKKSTKKAGHSTLTLIYVK